jgi:hypothetical protein
VAELHDILFGLLELRNKHAEMVARKATAAE